MGNALLYSTRPEPKLKLKMPKGGGLTSRRTTCKIPTTSSTSPPTKRWPRFSALTVSVLSVWPNSCLLTSHKHWVLSIFFLNKIMTTYDKKRIRQKKPSNHPIYDDFYQIVLAPY